MSIFDPPHPGPGRRSSLPLPSQPRRGRLTPNEASRNVGRITGGTDACHARRARRHPGRGDPRGGGRVVPRHAQHRGRCHRAGRQRRARPARGGEPIPAPAAPPPTFTGGGAVMFGAGATPRRVFPIMTVLRGKRDRVDADASTASMQRQPGDARGRLRPRRRGCNTFESSDADRIQGVPPPPSFPPAVGGGTFFTRGASPATSSIPAWGRRDVLRGAPSPPERPRGCRGVVVSAVCLLAVLFGHEHRPG